jgi:hypothetical protein
MSMTGDFSELRGVKLELAKKSLPPKYFIFVSENDGESFYRSQEINYHRINVRVKKGIITHVDGVN